MIFNLESSCIPDCKVLGNKGAGLVQMMQLGLPVPPGFILSIGSQTVLRKEDILQALVALEKKTGLLWNDPNRPLIVSVRSSGKTSMPGMMDTFLNVGLCQETLPGFAQRIGSLDEAQKNLTHLNDIFCRTKIPLDHPTESLYGAIQAVFDSWYGERARAFRAYQAMDQEGGTAVIVQAMVFGQAPQSGTGVAFTRHPLDGKKGLFGEYLLGHQGEALVGGHETPLELRLLAQHHPCVFSNLEKIAKILEEDRKSIQEIEFTFERNVLWILQTRPAKHSAHAAFEKVWQDIQDQKIAFCQGMLQLDPLLFSALIHGQVKNAPTHQVLARALGASPGVVRGRLWWDPKTLPEDGILALNELTPDHVPQALKCAGVLTRRGGMTSHGAVVMRGAGKPLISDVPMEWRDDKLFLEGHFLSQGHPLTLDGQAGIVYEGHQDIILKDLPTCIHALLDQGDAYAPFCVMANADTAQDIERALAWGAQGVGLCRSEHMMLSPQCLFWLQVFFLSCQPEQKEIALTHLEAFHTRDLLDIIHVLQDKPLTFRLLDPPLHEFLPSATQDLTALSQFLNLSTHDMRAKIQSVQEVNPMLGQRGVRLGMHYPELYRMQLRVLGRLPKQDQIQVLVPFIMDETEVDNVKQMALEEGFKGPFGIMIEVPRAALLAEKLAAKVDFFSFGTNDLTQMTYGLSRDDASSFLKRYAMEDPFVELDQTGVGQLITWACKNGRAGNPKLKISLCGEQASSLKAMDFFKNVGIDSVSVSPFKILPTRLGAIQSGLKSKEFSMA